MSDEDKTEDYSKNAGSTTNEKSSARLRRATENGAIGVKGAFAKRKRETESTTGSKTNEVGMTRRFLRSQAREEGQATDGNVTEAEGHEQMPDAERSMTDSENAQETSLLHTPRVTPSKWDTETRCVGLAMKILREILSCVWCGEQNTLYKRGTDSLGSLLLKCKMYQKCIAGSTVLDKMTKQLGQHWRLKATITLAKVWKCLRMMVMKK